MSPLKAIAAFVTEFFREGAEDRPVRTKMEIEELSLKDGKLVLVAKTTILDEEN